MDGSFPRNARIRKRFAALKREMEPVIKRRRIHGTHRWSDHQTESVLHCVAEAVKENAEFFEAAFVSTPKISNPARKRGILDREQSTVKTIYRNEGFMKTLNRSEDLMPKCTTELPTPVTTSGNNMNVHDDVIVVEKCIEGANSDNDHHEIPLRKKRAFYFYKEAHERNHIPCTDSSDNVIYTSSSESRTSYRALTCGERGVISEETFKDAKETFIDILFNTVAEAKEAGIGLEGMLHSVPLELIPMEVFFMESEKEVTDILWQRLAQKFTDDIEYDHLSDEEVFIDCVNDDSTSDSSQLSDVTNPEYDGDSQKPLDNLILEIEATPSGHGDGIKFSYKHEKFLLKSASSLEQTVGEEQCANFVRDVNLMAKHSLKYKKHCKNKQMKKLERANQPKIKSKLRVMATIILDILKQPKDTREKCHVVYPVQVCDPEKLGADREKIIEEMQSRGFLVTIPVRIHLKGGIITDSACFTLPSVVFKDLDLPALSALNASPKVRLFQNTCDAEYQSKTDRVSTKKSDIYEIPEEALRCETPYVFQIQEEKKLMAIPFPKCSESVKEIIRQQENKTCKKSNKDKKKKAENAVLGKNIQTHNADPQKNENFSQNQKNETELCPQKDIPRQSLKAELHNQNVATQNHGTVILNEMHAIIEKWKPELYRQPVIQKNEIPRKSIGAGSHNQNIGPQDPGTHTLNENILQKPKQKPGLNRQRDTRKNDIPTKSMNAGSHNKNTGPQNPEEDILNKILSRKEKSEPEFHRQSVTQKNKTELCVQKDIPRKSMKAGSRNQNVDAQNQKLRPDLQRQQNVQKSDIPRKSMNAGSHNKNTGPQNPEEDILNKILSRKEKPEPEFHRQSVTQKNKTELCVQKDIPRKSMKAGSRNQNVDAQNRKLRPDLQRQQNVQKSDIPRKSMNAGSHNQNTGPQNPEEDILNKILSRKEKSEPEFHRQSVTQKNKTELCVQKDIPRKSMKAGSRNQNVDAQNQKMKLDLHRQRDTQNNDIRRKSIGAGSHNKNTGPQNPEMDILNKILSRKEKSEQEFHRQSITQKNKTELCVQKDIPRKRMKAGAHNQNVDAQNQKLKPDLQRQQNVQKSDIPRKSMNAGSHNQSVGPQNPSTDILNKILLKNEKSKPESHQRDIQKNDIPNKSMGIGSHNQYVGPQDYEILSKKEKSKPELRQRDIQKNDIPKKSIGAGSHNQKEFQSNLHSFINNFSGHLMQEEAPSKPYNSQGKQQHIPNTVSHSIHPQDKRTKNMYEKDFHKLKQQKIDAENQDYLNRTEFFDGNHSKYQNVKSYSTVHNQLPRDVRSRKNKFDFIDEKDLIQQEVNPRYYTSQTQQQQKRNLSAGPYTSRIIHPQEKRKKTNAENFPQQTKNVGHYAQCDYRLPSSETASSLDNQFYCAKDNQLPRNLNAKTSSQHGRNRAKPPSLSVRNAILILKRAMNYSKYYNQNCNSNSEEHTDSTSSTLVPNQSDTESICSLCNRHETPRERQYKKAPQAAPASYCRLPSLRDESSVKHRVRFASRANIHHYEVNKPIAPFNPKKRYVKKKYAPPPKNVNHKNVNANKSQQQVQKQTIWIPW